MTMLHISFFKFQELKKQLPLQKSERKHRKTNMKLCYVIDSNDSNRFEESSLTNRFLMSEKKTSSRVE